MAHRSHHRASSVPSSPSTSRFTPSTPSKAATSTPAETNPLATANTATLLQPRVAVVLNVPRPWHPWLFALRLSSILPALWWGAPTILRLVLRVLDLLLDSRDGPGYRPGDCPLTETALATIWCFASGYLSFFFTDCLMSRWLINYTPQATMVRLVTINAVNAYATSILLTIAGGYRDPRLLLPGWVGIATALTMCYHLVHQKINIRKETSTSINVFSIASYLSMVTLLVHMHKYQPGYPKMPLVSGLERVWYHAYRIGYQIRDSLEHGEL